MQQRQPQRGLLKMGLCVTLLGIIAHGCIGLSPAGSPAATSTTAAVLPGQSGPGPETTVDVTLGPSKTKKPKLTPGVTTTTPTDGGTTVPTDAGTATQQPTNVPTDQPTIGPSDTGFHLRSFILA